MKKKGIKMMAMNERDQPVKRLDSLTEQEILADRERQKIRDEKSRNPQIKKKKTRSGSPEEATE